MKKFLGLILVVAGITTLSSCYMPYGASYGYGPGPRGPRPGYHHGPHRVGPGGPGHYKGGGPGYHKGPSQGHYNRGGNYGPRR